MADTAKHTVIHVPDRVRWGKLVKSWAMGVNLISPGSPLPPIPRTLSEFKHVCLEVFKIDMEIPDHLGFGVMQHDENTFILRLPPKALLERTHAQLGSFDAYPIPHFYNVAYGVTELRVRGMSIEDFHAGRVGDYTVTLCA
jgi:hypothetical protein